MRFALPLTLSLLCLGLGGCGQKGPLYLPTDPPPTKTTPRPESKAPASTNEGSQPPSQQSKPTQTN